MVGPGAWLRRVTPLSGDEKPDLARIGRVVEELFPEAQGVWVYGSVAHGRAHARSDLDIAILPDRLIDPWERHERAAQVGDRIGGDVDLVGLRRVSRMLRFEVAARGRRVAARDPWACQQAIDMAHRMTFLRKLAIADDTGTVFVNLARAGLIPAALPESMRRMVGFGDVAVHEYQALDLDKLRFIIEHRLADLLAFSKAMLQADPDG